MDVGNLRFWELFELFGSSTPLKFEKAANGPVTIGVDNGGTLLVKRK